MTIRRRSNHLTTDARSQARKRTILRVAGGVRPSPETLRFLKGDRLPRGRLFLSQTLRIRSPQASLAPLIPSAPQPLTP